MVVISDGRFELPDQLYYNKNQHVYFDIDKRLVGLDQLGFSFMKNPTELKVLVEEEVHVGEPMAVITAENGITTMDSPVAGKIKTINKNALSYMKDETYSRGYILELENVNEIDPSLVTGFEVAKWVKTEAKLLLSGEYSFKVIAIGDSATGKTAIKVRFSDDYFKKDLKTTLGVDFGSKEILFETQGVDSLLSDTNRIKVKLNIWDAAGQKHFKKIRPMYYRGAKGALLVYDVNNPVSFKSLDSWIEELDENTNHKIPVMLIGNKIDLERKVPIAEAKAYAEIHGFDFIETSAKTGANVQDALKKLVMRIYDQEK
jgi:Ras-related protein Rab-2A